MEMKRLMSLLGLEIYNNEITYEVGNSCLDNIVVSKCMKSISVKCQDWDVSDYLGIMAVIMSVNNNSYKKGMFMTEGKREMRRLMNETTVEKFKNEIRSFIDHPEIYNYDDVNDAYDNFVSNIRKIYDECIPLQAVKRRNEHKGQMD